MNNIALCIPIRLHSKRLPKKLLLKFGNETCISKVYNEVIKVKYISKKDVYFFYEEDKELYNNIKQLTKNLISTNTANDAIDRVSKNINKLSSKYSTIVIIQGDEPFIDHRNIEYIIEKHLSLSTEEHHKVMFSTIHTKPRDTNNICLPEEVKVVCDMNNNALYYSRSNIPTTKKNISGKVRLCGGIFVFSRKRIEIFRKYIDSPLRNTEDISQLSVLEYGFKIKSWEVPYYLERSLDTEKDYDFLKKKYL